MTRVAKVHCDDTVFYFVDGVRSDAYDDEEVLSELLGNDFEVYWVRGAYSYDNNDQDQLLQRIESSETLEQFKELHDEYPELIES